MRTMTDLLSPDSHCVAPLPLTITSCRCHVQDVNWQDSVMRRHCRLINIGYCTLKVQLPGKTSSFASQSWPSCHWSSGALSLSHDPKTSDSPTALTVSPNDSSHCFRIIVVDTAVSAGELATAWARTVSGLYIACKAAISINWMV